MHGRARQLRHAPRLHDPDAEAVGDVVLQLGGQRGGAAEDVAEAAADVVVARLGPLGQHDDDGWRCLQVRDAVRGDVAQEGRVGEGAPAHEEGGCEGLCGGADGPELAVGVVEREEAEPALRRAGGWGVGLLEVPHVEGLCGVGDDVLMCYHDAFWEAGRAARVVEDGGGRARVLRGEAWPVPG